MPSTASSPASKPPWRPALADIEDAAARLLGQAVRTPLLESPLLNRRLGMRLLVKAEVLQRTGSFKFRGAYNRISRLTPAELAAGVVAFSSGNHAQGVSEAARLCGAKAVIVMPSDAPATKIAGTRALGGEVVLYDREREDREAIGRRIAAERNLTLVPPYDDPWIIAGQGTAGLEIAQQCRELGVAPDVVMVCCSGGGLTAGIATAIKAMLPATAVYAVEPDGFDDTVRSLRAGERLSILPGQKSLCDALMTPTPGELTFAINRVLLAGAVSVSDAEVEAAMVAAFRHFKLVVEPGGAAALAAALAGKVAVAGKTVVAVATGGNVDPPLYAQILGRARVD
jgi:threonine dehydratase